MKFTAADIKSICITLIIAYFTYTHAQDSSTGPDGSTGTDSSTGTAAIIISSTGSTNDTNTTQESSSTGGSGVTPVVYKQYMTHEWYVCGYQEVGADRGYYLNHGQKDSQGKTIERYWEDPSWPSYIECPVWEPFKNDTCKYTPKPYPQCSGRSPTSNCFAQERLNVSADFEPHGYNDTVNTGFVTWKKNSNDTLEKFQLSDEEIARYKRGIYCNGYDATRRFIKGDQLDSDGICIVFGGGYRLWKLRFFPKVDQFAMLTIQNSYDPDTVHPAFQHIGTAFQVELNGVRSESKARYGYVSSTECGANSTSDCDKIGGANPNTCTVVPFHTIIVNLEGGVISDIAFDNDCSLCGNEYCVGGNCAQDITTCAIRNGTITKNSDEATRTVTDCDFKVYVSWAGTDADGTYLSSSGRRLSQFRRWSLNSVYNQASNIDIGGGLDVVPSPDAEFN